MLKWLNRFFKHSLHTPWHTRKTFTKTAISNIEKAIGESEHLHSGEIRFVVEGALDTQELCHQMTSRQRAKYWFAHLGIWDTEHNNGILIYLLLADHKVEIVADRGIDAHIGAAGWATICHLMETEFRAQHFETGVLLGIQHMTTLLCEHFPAQRQKRNELPNQVVIL